MISDQKNVMLVNIGGSRIRVARLNGKKISITLDQESGDTLEDLISQIKSEVSSINIPFDEIIVACPGLVRLDGSVGSALHSAVRNTKLNH